MHGFKAFEHSRCVIIAKALAKTTGLSAKGVNFANNGGFPLRIAAALAVNRVKLSQKEL